MIPCRPVAPLTVEPRKGWKSVLAAVVLTGTLPLPSGSRTRRAQWRLGPGLPYCRLLRA